MYYHQRLTLQSDLSDVWLPRQLGSCADSEDLHAAAAQMPQVSHTRPRPRGQSKLGLVIWLQVN